MTTANVLSHILGFPRIGVDRQMKTAVESYWKGDLTLAQLEETGRQIQHSNWKTQVDAGLSFVTVGDFCWYDHILDHSIMFGVVPERFQSDYGKTHLLNTMFCMGRGKAPDTKEAHACSMMKWFNTNYHYIVPELVENQQFKLDARKLIETIKHARANIAVNRKVVVKPVIVGPLTYLYMSKAKQTDFNKYKLLPKLLNVYVELLKELETQANVEWVQIDEPILGLDLDEDVLKLYQETYDKLKQACGGSGKKLKILLTTYFTGLDGKNLDTVGKLPVDGLHLDLCADPNQWEVVVTKIRPDVVLSLGLINGRNIWKADLAKCLSIVEKVKAKTKNTLWLGSSCSLLHCPVDLDAETSLNTEVKNWLSFSKQKVLEIAHLAKALNQGKESVPENYLSENRKAIESRQTSKRIHNQSVKDRCKNVDKVSSSRKSPYVKRAVEQKKSLKLPLFPTTTIGSFPQTKEIRAIRHDLKTGKISEAEYVAKIKQVTAEVVKIQEDLGLDVLVHGEAERNDMVEYFGELLDGYTFSKNGWVQSYGSRCVKPPIIFGDVSRPKPMTIEWTKHAQTLTKHVMKGMLTGPVTMLSWSFVRDDQPTSQTSLQLAFALRDEIVDLEANGIRVIQLDEPAFREALPLRKKDWPEYLKWSVHSFKIATCGIKDETQIHTHMCYSEFSDVIESIAALDADVITIESSRSDMIILKAFERFSYPNDIGPGVYDIHSPIVPTTDEMVKLLEMALKYIPASRLWVNPDCGLKTRSWTETNASLTNMVAAAKILRQKHAK